MDKVLYIGLRPDMYKILVVDDHPLVGDGITTMLSDLPHFKVVAKCRSGRDARAQVAHELPDLILLDINLPDESGLELCAEWRKQHSGLHIIGLSSVAEAPVITQFLAQGGNGYLLKDMERGELIEAIETVINGRIYLSRGANQQVLQQYRSVTDAVRKAPILTRREKEIIQLLNEGLNGPDIAQKLSLSQYTVETHRKNLLQKFDAHSTGQLLKLAREFRIL